MSSVDLSRLRAFYESFKLIGYLGSFLTVFLFLSFTLLNGNVIGSGIYLLSILFVWFISYLFSKIPISEDASLVGAKSYYCDFLQIGESYRFPSFSTTLIFFTATYVISSIFRSDNTPNWLLYVFFGIIGCADIIAKVYGNCTNTYFALGSAVIGGLIGIFVAWILEESNAKRYYIFSDTPSNKAVCSRPKDTQFKCTVSRNGELIRDTSKDVSSDE